MTAVVLDASALLAMLLAEPGAETVRAALADAAISTVNLSELVGYFARNGASETQIREILDPLPVERMPFDAELAYAAGLLAARTRRFGLSLGDRACLALARKLGARALTANRSWRNVAAALGLEIALIR